MVSDEWMNGQQPNPIYIVDCPVLNACLSQIDGVCVTTNLFITLYAKVDVSEAMCIVCNSLASVNWNKNRFREFVVILITLI